MGRIQFMSISLVIDTSTQRTAVAIIQDGRMMVEFHHDDALAHGEILPRLVEKVLVENSHVDQVIVGMGPGPFTGLRVGIAFAASFALARKIPWLGVCSLDGIVPSEGTNSRGEYLVATDARRKEVFWARYRDGVRISQPHVGAPQTLKLLNISAYGEGAQKYNFISNSELLYPNPVLLEKVGREGPHYTTPIYVRRPDAFSAPVGVSFRAMNYADLVSVFDIEKKSYLDDPWSMAQLKEELAGKNRWYFVAEFQNRIVGYVGALHAGEVTDVLTLTVHSEFRRKGIGRELLRRLIDWARVQKAEAIMLEMREGNSQAQPLYVDFGFVELTKRDNYYGPGLTAIIMRKDLT